MEAKIVAENFRNECLTMLDRPGLSPELEYRMRKILDRFLPLMDKMYLKTVKGTETVSLCIAKAKKVGDHVGADDETLYKLLTDLENTHEDFLNRAYEFRIKAG